MCIICASKSGVQQPTDTTLRAMFRHNPHGAGFMYARNGKVTIHKGFMNIGDFLAAVHAEKFTPNDSVVYHFRISTQAGVTASMTHPFPLSNQPKMMQALDLTCRCGIAHNGIIRLTSDPDNHHYSDTAISLPNTSPKSSAGRLTSKTLLRWSLSGSWQNQNSPLWTLTATSPRSDTSSMTTACSSATTAIRLACGKLNRLLPNQELPPAGGFSCCAGFTPRWRVSGFQIKGREGFGLGGTSGTCGQRRRDVGKRVAGVATKKKRRAIA